MTTNPPRNMANLIHPEISEILDGQLCPEPLYWTRRGRVRPATRGVVTSSSTLADALEGEDRHPAGKAEEVVDNTKKVLGDSPIDGDSPTDGWIHHHPSS